jgi:hypothetical protein
VSSMSVSSRWRTPSCANMAHHLCDQGFPSEHNPVGGASPLRKSWPRPGMAARGGEHRRRARAPNATMCRRRLKTGHPATGRVLVNVATLVGPGRLAAR